MADKERSNIAKCKEWSIAVKNRDKKCIRCHSDFKLISHHVLSWTVFEELRFDLSNGITLCNSCHKEFHKKYGNKCIEKDSIHSFLKSKIPILNPKTNEFKETDIHHNRWTILDKPVKRVGNKYFILCKCSCGTIREVSKSSILSGKSKSCGCLHKEQTSERMKGEKNHQYKHGCSKRNKWSKEYVTWSSIKSRCENVNCRAYDLYGERGIKICSSWQNNFMKFLIDVGPAPSPKHELDRINNNGNYELNNVRWATRKENMLNTRSNKFLIINNITKTYSEWEEHFELPPKTISRRIKSNWTPEECLLPLNSRRKNGK